MPSISKSVLRLSAGLALVLLAACQNPTGMAGAGDVAAGDRATIDRLLRLVDERLAIAPQVARSKWNSGAPIDVPEREAAILERVTERAAEGGVDADFARAFFQAQFEASKVVQTDLHDAWRADQRGPFESAPDLGADIRPALDRLTPQLVEALAAFQTIEPGAAPLAYLRARSPVLVRDDADGRARAEAVAPLEARLAP